MSVLNPNLETYGDVKSVSVSTWHDDIILTLLHLDGVLSYRVVGEDTAVQHPFNGLDYDFIGSVGTCVVDNTLLLSWSNTETGYIKFARYDLVTQQVTFSPINVVQGTTPSLEIYSNTRLALGYARGGASKVVVSPDLGTSWGLVPPVEHVVNAGNGNIFAVDITNPDTSSYLIYWAETDTPP